MRLTCPVMLVLLFISRPVARGESVYPQNCSLHCVRQGNPQCGYCRISQDDVQRSLGAAFFEPFGNCVPWPCDSFLGQQNPEVCQHYVDAPNNVTVHFLPSASSKHETTVVSWNPSPYGIGFLRGFQVSLQTLGTAHIYCQLFLIQKNSSLDPGHAQRVYHSDPFPLLPLDSRCVVTVMALPVPELWERFYTTKQFSTRSCPEKNGLEMCKKDWYPTYIEVTQDGDNVSVTFNLAPHNLEITQYFSTCYGAGRRNYVTVKPNFSVNQTHHRYHLANLVAATNYSCEIAADLVDAVRKRFRVWIQPTGDTPQDPEKTAVTVLLPVGLLLAAICIVSCVVFYQRKWRKLVEKKHLKPDILDEYCDKQEEPASVYITPRTTPPRLLIIYSDKDGPAHIAVVLQLAVFLQKHMAVQVSLDLWEALSMMEEGTFSWYSSRIQESDFILVICSAGLQKKHLESMRTSEDELEDNPDHHISSALVAMIGEELCHTKARGLDLSKYITAIFEYSREMDVPTVLGLASHYTLPRDFPLLFSHFHAMALHRPGSRLQVAHISEEDYTRLPAGAALSLAIQQARMGLGDTRTGTKGSSQTSGDT
ncbi:interleukin-17 receptor D-like isoform X1 [Denticeps clupeoides]|uniref:interleukin-17 receptor D-like isoform X1 n=1 Tax=Denticeps clupeoides TaxID=299321 RepID=UPI0010A4EF96|nr:interleukin-17 receptor D-like isoform X1 [Denticeps clupeoides]